MICTCTLGLLLATFLPLTASADGPTSSESDAPKGVATIYSGERNRDDITFSQRQGASERGSLVPDKAARGGFALRHDPKVQPGGGMLWFGYTYSQAPGRIRAFFRIKVSDNTNPAPVAFIRGDIYHSDLNDPAAGWLELAVKGTDFKKPNVYQDFPLDRARGELGFGDWAIRTTGVTTVSYGGLTVRQVSRFTLPELMSLMRVPEKPAGVTLAENGGVHEVRGLYADLWGIGQAEPKRTASYASVGQQNTSLTGFPKDWPDIYANRAVILDNVPASAVTLVRCAMLKQYVLDGGCLVLMGDTHGISGGGWADTPLEPLLPVMGLKGSNLVRAALPLPVMPVGGAFAGLDWSVQPYTLFYHDVALRPGTETLLTAGGHPIAVRLASGKGQVIVLLNSVLGAKSAGAPGVPWWEWPDWPKLMAALLIARSETANQS